MQAEPGDHLRGAGRRIRELERAAVPGREVDRALELHIPPRTGVAHPDAGDADLDRPPDRELRGALVRQVLQFVHLQISLGNACALITH